jgi:hypothetical protein
LRKRVESHCGRLGTKIVTQSYHQNPAFQELFFHHFSSFLVTYSNRYQIHVKHSSQNVKSKNVIVCLPSNRNAIIKNLTLQYICPENSPKSDGMASLRLHHPYPNSASQKFCRTQLLLFPWTKKFGFARFLHNTYARHVTLCNRLHIHMVDPE